MTTSVPANVMAVPMSLQRSRLKELPLISSSAWNDVDMVRGAIQALENGMFDRASQVVDAMGRDDRIAGVMSTRARALPAVPMTLEPGTGPRAQDCLAAVEKHWDQMLPPEQLTQLMEWGLMIGAGPGRLNWTLGDVWVPTLECWHPRPLYFRWPEEAFFINVQGTDPVLPPGGAAATGQVGGQLRVTPGFDNWVLFTPYGAKRGWMKGCVRYLYTPWLVRQFGIRDWARYSEVHGMPIRQVVIPPSATESEVAAYMEEVANFGEENIIRSKRTADASDDPAKDAFEVKLVEALGRSTETFAGLVELANTCVAVALLGQNLTTEVKGGSFAAATAHGAIRDDILQSDSKLLAQCLREQILKPFAMWNFGDPECAPKPCWKTKPDEDKVAKGQGIINLGQGIKALLDTGAHPDVDKLLDDAGIPYTEDAGEPPAPEVLQPPGGRAPGAAAPGKPPVRLAAEELALESGLPEEMLLGQEYTDAVATAARDKGAKVMRATLTELLELVDKESSPTALVKALERHYAGMDPGPLAAVIREAITLASLNGRYTITAENVEQTSEE